MCRGGHLSSRLAEKLPRTVDVTPVDSLYSVAFYAFLSFHPFSRCLSSVLRGRHPRSKLLADSGFQCFAGATVTSHNDPPLPYPSLPSARTEPCYELSPLGPPVTDFVLWELFPWPVTLNGSAACICMLQAMGFSMASLS